MSRSQTEQLKTTGKQKPQFDSPAVRLSRTFRAPVDRVWQAWTHIDFAKQWWGPKGWTSPSGRMDVREGGEYLLAMQGPDGKVFWSGGIFKELEPHKRIVWTDHFADEQGNPISANAVGMPGNWPEEAYVTIEFESLGSNETRMNLIHEGIPKEMHDDCVQGWSESFDKLQAILEKQ